MYDVRCSKYRMFNLCKREFVNLHINISISDPLTNKIILEVYLYIVSISFDILTLRRYHDFLDIFL